MYFEIEHKYLVRSLSDVDYKLKKKKTWRQAYLNIDETNFIQARISANDESGKGYLNIKSPRNGCIRNEYECDIPFNIASEIITKSDFQIMKIRYYFEKNEHGHEWVVDEYLGANSGLLIAELELSEDIKDFYVPKWCDEDVTNNEAFYNYFLAVVPMKSDAGKAWRLCRTDFLDEHPEYENCKSELERFLHFAELFQ